MTTPAALLSLASLFVVSFGGGLQAAQDRPTQEDLGVLVGTVVNSMHAVSSRSPIAVAASSHGIGSPVVAVLQTFRIIRWGEAGADHAFIEICARVSVHDPDVEVPARVGIARLESKSFDVKFRLHATKDNSGDWRAVILPMQDTAPASEALCALESIPEPAKGRSPVNETEGDRVSQPPSKAALSRDTDEFTSPVLVRNVAPKYTQAALRAKIEGSVELEAVVDSTGAVTDVRVVRSLDTIYGLDQEAVRAARQWKFKPGEMKGQPVAVLVTLILEFRLRRDLG